MIEIRVTAARVEVVRFLPTSDLEEDLDLAAWQLIRPLVDQVDRRLRKAASNATAAGTCQACGRMLLTSDRRRGVCTNRRSCAQFARRSQKRPQAEKPRQGPASGQRGGE